MNAKPRLMMALSRKSRKACNSCNGTGKRTFLQMTPPAVKAMMVPESEGGYHRHSMPCLCVKPAMRNV